MTPGRSFELRLSGHSARSAERRAQKGNGTMYESRHHAPLPRSRFLLRLAAHACVAIALLVCSLLIGMAGYAGFEHLPWRDGFLNAAMLLGGMGPVNAPQTDEGKLFEGLYALYA